MKQTIKLMLTAAALVAATSAPAQEVIQLGKGSYASCPPLSVSKSATHGGDQSQYMMVRPLKIHERSNQPIPTNDWWTNLINADDTHYGRLSGHLWSYPQYVEANTYGIDVQQPNGWIANGTEMKCNTKLVLKGQGFNATTAIAQRWHDWDVSFSMRDKKQLMYVTMAHGIPFTWVEMQNVSPTVTIENTNEDLGDDNTYDKTAAVHVYDRNGAEIKTTTRLSAFAIEKGGDIYGVYLPEGTDVVVENGVVSIAFNGEHQYVSIGILPSKAQLKVFADYAYSVPRSTRVDWKYNAAQGKVYTKWSVKAVDLRTGVAIPGIGGEDASPQPTPEPAQPDDDGLTDVAVGEGGYDGPAQAPRRQASDDDDLDEGDGTVQVMQGFLPHQYRDTGNPCTLPFNGVVYDTPHGKLKMCTGTEFDVVYNFYGMLPYYALPVDGDYAEAGYDEVKMLAMLQTYADTGTFGDDTYWGGKGLTQMALYMMFAREMGNVALFRQCRDRLKASLVDWLTYTPGEQTRFFAYYPRWGGMVGYATSYDSDTFNDHHFHYGYYTLAAALLALVDDDFRDGYGEVLKLIAKDYANWDRTDTRFPFLRMLDPWAGHSFAGGLGDGNGNGQESTSEAMQGWGGLYLLGVALKDDAMRDAGIFGWVTEARGTAEYWFDRHTDPNRDMSSFHQAKSDEYNINYDRFWFQKEENGKWVKDADKGPIPYSSNFTCHGVGYWTYFGGDAVFVQGIQWMPISPALDYLAEDKEFAKWDYEQMWRLREHGDWSNSEGREAWLGDSDWGNVSLSYLQHSDPEQAARIFDEGWAKGYGTFRKSATNGITYFVTHSHLSHGDIDWSIHATIPTARVYKKGDGTKTYMAFNPTDAAVTVTFSDGATLSVPARQLAVSGQTSKAVTEITTEGTDSDPREEVGMENLALGKPVTASSEQTPAPAANAVDGKGNSRWESAHEDGQWIAVDLGESVEIYKLKISWEAAYASQYDILLSADGQSWTTAKSMTTSGGTDVVMMGDQAARYVKVVGNKRATNYGISIYEIEVNGRRQSAADTDLLGLKIASDPVILKQYQPAQLSVKALTCGRQWVANPTVTYQTKDGKVTADGVFTPRNAGTVTVTAKSGSLSVAKELSVEEALYLATLEVLPRQAEIVIGGEGQEYTLTGKDQFKGAMTPNIDNLTFRVCTYEQTGTWIDQSDWNKEKPIYRMTDTGAGTFDASTRTLKMTLEGDYALIVTGLATADTVFVKACEQTEVNLAYQKPVTATSSNGGNTADKAVDGDAGTRWESAHGSDDEALTVDLQAVYKINKVVFNWEGAYAKKYDLQVSVDGQTWTTVKTVTPTGIPNGGQDTQTFTEVEARFVRMQGIKRATNYGYSLYEFEVYGTEKVRDIDPDDDDDPTLDTNDSWDPTWDAEPGTIDESVGEDSEIVTGIRSVDGAAPEQPLYMLDGRRVQQPQQKGIYVRRGRKYVR